MIKKKLVLLAVFSLFFILSVSFVLGNLLSSQLSVSSFNQSVSNVYNFTINNTNIPAGINFTQVNITFPSQFILNLSANGTTSTGVFTNASNTLTWRNNTAGWQVVTNGTSKYFWVNAIGSIPGDYNITITTNDSSGQTNTTNVSVRINNTGVLYTSQLAGIHGNLVTDDSATINAAILALSNSGGGDLIWDGTYAFKSSLILQSYVHIRAVDNSVRMRYFGANASGSDLNCIRNANVRKGLPTRGTTNSFSEPSVQIELPLQVGANLTADATTLTLKTNQSQLLDTIPADGLLINNGAEILKITSIVSGDTYNIVRAQNGTTASGASVGSILTETIIDDDISIENLNVNCGGNTYNSRLISEAYSFWNMGLFLGGVKNVNLTNITITNTPTFGMMIHNIGNISIIGANVDTTDGVGAWDDTVHFWGPINNITIRNLTTHCSDNSLAFNFGEPDAIRDTATSLTIPFMGAGDIDNIFVENAVLNSTGYPEISLFGSPNTKITNLVLNNITIVPTPGIDVWVYDQGKNFGYVGLYIDNFNLSNVYSEGFIQANWDIDLYTSAPYDPGIDLYNGRIRNFFINKVKYATEETLLLNIPSGMTIDNLTINGAVYPGGTLVWNEGVITNLALGSNLAGTAVNNNGIGVVSTTTNIESFIEISTPSGNSFSINQNASSLFNISINNTNPIFNVTNVTISFSGLSLVAGTNGTSSTGIFSNISSSYLIWNNSGESVVTSETKQFFWFNATTSTSGNYNITITAYNATGYAINSTNITVQVNDTTTDMGAESSSGSDYPTFYPSASQISNVYNLSMRANWQISFKVGNISHRLKVNNISKGVASITVSSSPQTKLMATGNDWRVDLDEDDYYDLLVKVKNITENTVNIAINSLHEKVINSTPINNTSVNNTNDNLSNADNSSTKDNDRVMLILIIFVIVIAALILVWLFYLRIYFWNKKIERSVNYTDKK